MLNGSWRYLFPIAFTYVGTVVGAGFASGQEIIHFFTRYGIYGKVGIWVSLILFSFFGVRMMVLGARISADSYKEVNQYLFGTRIARIMNPFVDIILFGVSAAMIAGIGAIFREQLHLSGFMGMILTILLALWVMHRGMEGILSLNTLVVPFMLLFSLIIAITSFTSSSSQPFHPIMPEGGLLSSLFAAFTYVSYNIAMSQAILVPMGKEIKDERVLLWGGLTGALFLGLMLFAADFAFSVRGMQLFRYEIPMAEVITRLGIWIKAFFLFIMGAEIFTTLISNVYGLARKLDGWLSWRERNWIWLILLGGLLVAQVGFQSFITVIYPFFGYCGFAYMVMMVVRNKAK